MELAQLVTASIAISQSKLTASRVLALIGARDGKSMTEAAQSMGHTTAAMTGLVAALEKDGLIIRKHDTDDRRKVLLFLTEQGSDKLLDLVNKSVEIEEVNA